MSKIDELTDGDSTTVTAECRTESITSTASLKPTVKAESLYDPKGWKCFELMASDDTEDDCSDGEWSEDELDDMGACAECVPKKGVRHFRCEKCNPHAMKECADCHLLFNVGNINWPIRGASVCMPCLLGISTYPCIGGHWTRGREYDQPLQWSLHSVFVDGCLERFVRFVSSFRRKYSFQYRNFDDCLVLATMSRESQDDSQRDCPSLAQWMKSGDPLTREHKSISCLLFMRLLPNDIRLLIIRMAYLDVASRRKIELSYQKISSRYMRHTTRPTIEWLFTI